MDETSSEWSFWKYKVVTFSFISRRMQKNIQSIEKLRTGHYTWAYNAQADVWNRLENQQAKLPQLALFFCWHTFCRDGTG